MYEIEKKIYESLNSKLTNQSAVFVIKRYLCLEWRWRKSKRLFHLFLEYILNTWNSHETKNIETQKTRILFSLKDIGSFFEFILLKEKKRNKVSSKRQRRVEKLYRNV